MARTSTMLLLTSDYADRLDALYARAQDVEGRLRAAERRAEQSPQPRRMDETPEHVALREEYQGVEAEYRALKDEAEAEGIRVTLAAIGRKEWRALKEKHPPRIEGDEDVQKADRLAGVNVDAVEDDLVYASLVEPAFKSRDAYDEWANEELTEGDFQAILTRAWGLVNVPRVDPKSLAGSPTRTSGAN